MRLLGAGLAGWAGWTGRDVQRPQLPGPAPAFAGLHGPCSHLRPPFVPHARTLRAAVRPSQARLLRPAAAAAAGRLAGQGRRLLPLCRLPARLLDGCARSRSWPGLNSQPILTLLLFFLSKLAALPAPHRPPGYFTSRAASKGAIRGAAAYLQGARQLEAFVGPPRSGKGEPGCAAAGRLTR